MSQDARRRELKVGCFTTVILAVSVGLLVYIGIKKDLFAERAVFTVISTSGEGIESGMSVKLKGFRIGQVTGVSLENIDAVRVEIEILKKYVKWFKRDSVISLQRPIIGGAYLDLTPGSPEAPVLSPGSQMSMEQSEDLQKKLEERANIMLVEIEAVIANLRTLSDQIVDKSGPVQSTLVSFEAMSRKLNAEGGLLDYLSDPRPARRIDAILANAEAGTKSMTTLLDSTNRRIENLATIQAELEGLLREARGNLGQLAGLREKIDPILADAAIVAANLREATDNLSGLRREGEYGLKLGTELMQRMKETWPLSREDAPPASHPLPPEP
jgi:ABC-type transporter Mla subunit MlaD